MGLGQARIPRGDGRRKIPAAEGVIGEGEIVRAEDGDWAAQGPEHRPDVSFRIDRGPAPGAVTAGGRRLTELVEEPREFAAAITAIISRLTCLKFSMFKTNSAKNSQ